MKRSERQACELGGMTYQFILAVEGGEGVEEGAAIALEGGGELGALEVAGAGGEMRGDGEEEGGLTRGGQGAGRGSNRGRSGSRRIRRARRGGSPGSRSWGAEGLRVPSGSRVR